MLGHFNLGNARVFQDVVHEPRADRGGIQVPLGENRCDGKRVRDVGLARLAELTEVRVVGVAERVLDALYVGLREVLAAAGEEFGGRRDDLRLHHRGVERKIGVFGNDFISTPVEVRIIVVFLVALGLGGDDRTRCDRDVAEGGVGEIDGGGHDVFGSLKKFAALVLRGRQRGVCSFV